MSQRESEEQARALLELSPPAHPGDRLASRRSLVINARARERWASPRASRSRRTWCGGAPSRAQYRHEEYARRCAQAPCKALRSGGRLEPMTVRVASAEGGERHVEIHAHIVGGKALVSVVDLTDHLRQEDSLRGAKELAERASSAKSQFLSSVSHELRTPLNAILGFAQLLETDESAAEVHRAHAREILESGYHLLALVDDVLDLTRIESGRVSVSLGAVPLEEAVRESLTLVEAQAQVRSVSIVVADEWPAAVIADHTRLRQVLINLLSNAVKYNVAGGQVEVGCEVLEGAAPKVRVSVRDSGPGIPEKRMSELFQPFNRLGAEGLGVEGTGIGLVVAKQLLELMGGVIGAESRLGEGSTFWFDLPLASSADPSARVGPATTPRTVRKERTPVAARRPRILVAEDQPMNQRLLCLQLEQVGAFDVVVVQHGAQALDRWQGGDVDLILTDCNMPFIDGYRLAAAVREREKHLARHVPIIAVTASAMKEDIDRCLAAGMDACLPKPLSVASLGEALRSGCRPVGARPRRAPGRPAAGATWRRSGR
ncbi:MAG: ATP-binding protein [Myxococcota bacterium]